MSKKMGRPLVPIDRKQFESLCGLQCTKEEVADFFGCSEDTIDRWCEREYGESFAVVFRKKRGNGKISLRRKQWHLADKSAAMAIFLGKNYLGQTDNVVVENPGQVSAIEKIANLIINGNAGEEESQGPDEN